MFLEKMHAQHQLSRFWLIREGSLDNDVAVDEAPSPKLNELQPQGSTSGIHVSFSLILESRASAAATLPNEVVAENPAYRNLGHRREMAHGPRTHLGQEKLQHRTGNPNTSSRQGDSNNLQH